MKLLGLAVLYSFPAPVFLVLVGLVFGRLIDMLPLISLVWIAVIYINLILADFQTWNVKNGGPKDWI